MLEEMSDVGVNRSDGTPVAEEWLDFIHGGGDAPLVVFWLFLRLREGDAWRKVKGQATIPRHVWERLSDHSRDVCTSETTYDARWSGDPGAVRAQTVGDDELPLADRRPAAWRHTGAARLRPTLPGH